MVLMWQRPSRRGADQHTKVVALTANVIKTRKEYMDNGMDDVIAKPIKKSRVVEVFNQLFTEQEETQVEQVEPG